MTNDIVATIDISQLRNGLPAITPAFGMTLAEAIAICFEDQNNTSGVILTIEGDFQTQVRFLYPNVTAQMRLCWNDEVAATEQAAYGIAFLLIRHLSALTVIERSRQGTGFDYWLGIDQPNMPFQRMMRLEVSGIRRGDRRLMNARVRMKTDQVRRFASSLPAYVVVVEFGTPCADIVQV
jgi:hypothetical protein